VVVGGGEIQRGRLPALLQAGADVRIVSPALNPLGHAGSGKTKLNGAKRNLLPKIWKAPFLSSQRLPSERETNPYIAPRMLWTLCNAVDDIQNCHFYTASVVQRAIADCDLDNGKSPALAQRLRKELKRNLVREYESGLEC